MMESLTAVATVQRATALADFDVRASRREIEGLAVPYNRPARVSDDGGRTWYREAFADRVFSRSTMPANTGRVRLNWTHDERFELLTWIGRMLRLTESAEGLVMVARVDESPFGDAALAKIADRQAGGDQRAFGLSVSARVMAESAPRADGIVWRTRAHLRHVAVVEDPAYGTAQITAMRAAEQQQARKIDTWKARLERMRQGTGLH